MAMEPDDSETDDAQLQEDLFRRLIEQNPVEESIDICPGAIVQVSGLKKMCELNGQIGVARCPDPTSPGRWHVVFDDLACGKRHIKSFKQVSLNVIAPPKEQNCEDLQNQDNQDNQEKQENQYNQENQENQESRENLENHEKQENQYNKDNQENPESLENQERQQYQKNQENQEHQENQENQEHQEQQRQETQVDVHGPVIETPVPSERDSLKPVAPESSSNHKPSIHQVKNNSFDAWCAGKPVKVVGFKTKAALNGRRGVLLRADPIRPGFWHVDFSKDNGKKEMKSISRQHLVLQLPPNCRKCAPVIVIEDDDDEQTEQAEQSEQAEQPQENGGKVDKSILGKVSRLMLKKDYRAVAALVAEYPDSIPEQSLKMVRNWLFKHKSETTESPSRPAGQRGSKRKTRPHEADVANGSTGAVSHQTLPWRCAASPAAESAKLLPATAKASIQASILNRTRVMPNGVGNQVKEASGPPMKRLRATTTTKIAFQAAPKASEAFNRIAAAKKEPSAFQKYNVIIPKVPPRPPSSSASAPTLSSAGVHKEKEAWQQIRGPQQRMLAPRKEGLFKQVLTPGLVNMGCTASASSASKATFPIKPWAVPSGSNVPIIPRNVPKSSAPQAWTASSRSVESLGSQGNPLAKGHSSFAHGKMGSKPLVDHEGRPFDFSTVVVNFANVGTTYGIRVLRRNKSVKVFDYDGIRKCVVHLKNKQRLNVIGVIYENFSGIDKGKEVHEPPADIQEMCSSIELTPRIMGMQHKSADDEMTIKCAYRRNCRFLDNDNYRDWRLFMRDESVRKWLQEWQELLQLRYYFDTGLGTFDTLDGNVPAENLASR